MAANINKNLSMQKGRPAAAGRPYNFIDSRYRLVNVQLTTASEKAA